MNRADAELAFQKQRTMNLFRLTFHADASPKAVAFLLAQAGKNIHMDRMSYDRLVTVMRENSWQSDRGRVVTVRPLPAFDKELFMRQLIAHLEKIEPL